MICTINRIEDTNSRMSPDTWKVLLFLIGAVINGTYQLQDVKRNRGTSKKLPAYTIQTDNHENINLKSSQRNDKFVAGLFDNTRKSRHTEKGIAGTDMNKAEKSKFRNINNLAHAKKHIGLIHKTHKDMYEKSSTHSYYSSVDSDTSLLRPFVPSLNIHQGNDSEVHRRQARHEHFNSMTNSSQTKPNGITGLIVVNASKEFTTWVNEPLNDMKQVKSNIIQTLNVTSEKLTAIGLNETKIFDDGIEKAVGRRKRKSLGNNLGDVADVNFNESIINRPAAMINDQNSVMMKSSSIKRTFGTERTFSEAMKDTSSYNLSENHKIVTSRTMPIKKLTTMNVNDLNAFRENDNVSVSSYPNQSIKEKVINDKKLIEKEKYIQVNLTFLDDERRDGTVSKDGFKHTSSMVMGNHQTSNDEDISRQPAPNLQQITLLPQDLYEKISIDNDSLLLISSTDNDNIVSVKRVIETPSKLPALEKLDYGLNGNADNVNLQFSVTTIGYENISLMNHALIVNANAENVSEKYVALNNRSSEQSFSYNGYHEDHKITDVEFDLNLHKNSSLFKSQNPIIFGQENTTGNGDQFGTNESLTSPEIFEFSTSFYKLIEINNDNKLLHGTFREVKDNAPNDRPVTAFFPINERLENMKKKENSNEYSNFYAPSVFISGLMKNGRGDGNNELSSPKSVRIFAKSNDAPISSMKSSKDPSSTSRTIGEKSNETWNLLPKEDFYIVGSFGFFDGNADDSIIEFKDNSGKEETSFVDQLENISTDSLLYIDTGNAYNSPDAFDFKSVVPVQSYLQFGEKLSVGSVAQEHIIDDNLYPERLYLSPNENNVDGKETKNLKNSMTSSTGNRNYGNASSTFLEALLFPISCAIVITSIVLTAIGISYKRTYRLTQPNLPIDMLGRFEERKVKDVEVIA